VKLPSILENRCGSTGETAGFMKVLVEAAGDRIVGFAMLGPEAGEVMAVVPTAMLGGVPYTVLRDAILAHPTMEYPKDGIRVNAVAPGVVDTLMHRNTPKEVMEGLSPMGRPSTSRTSRRRSST
jgi:hypothetical protein